jgi:hypothetical protein
MAVHIGSYGARIPAHDRDCGFSVSYLKERREKGCVSEVCCLQFVVCSLLSAVLARVGGLEKREVSGSCVGGKEGVGWEKWREMNRGLWVMGGTGVVRFLSEDEWHAGGCWER